MDANAERDPFDVGSDFLEGVAPTVTMHTSPMLKTEFSPWHKPRKQWIRDRQWGALVSALIKNLKLAQRGRSLTYLSLPGLDLLDVRSMESLFVEAGVRIKFLGLNHIESGQEAERAEQALSLNEVRSQAYVDPESTVITEKFEDLCDSGSIVSQQVLEEHKSFDVVNIDLCASFAKHKPGTWGSLYTAIHKLLVHQAYSRTEPWIFLITTRANKEKVDADAFAQLMNSVLDSVRQEIVFEYLDGRLGIESDAIRMRQLSQDKLSTLQHMNCFTASFGIWKLRLLISGDYKSKSHMHEPYAYHVESRDAVPDMVSMSFWCTRLPPAGVDPSGLSKVDLGNARPTVDEVYEACARRAFDASLNKVDLDSYLVENPAEYQAALDRSKSLLGRARYSLDGYERWVAEQQEKIVSMLAAKG
ncbi:TPA: hypothetical protein L4605_002387 [Pseudomonas aeruginosa]|nr:hypothetical protein [Pseudomonas aeruginosa]MBI8616130.1 hypothetical protein [Pseudomonas aeruginosa]MBX5825808.1 hypothetical protein [Pseudomonas aeruginosa]MBX5843948.1 hypothetical protein [Pseudomonas aeruginosa]MCT5362051.1 hypothetical protein [Pseudomonas aeruginosa]MCV0247697.1 hypothetical protein [Pseudomonas aeruginosa]